MMPRRARCTCGLGARNAKRLTPPSVRWKSESVVRHSLEAQSPAPATRGDISTPRPRANRTRLIRIIYKRQALARVRPQSTKLAINDAVTDSNSANPVSQHIEAIVGLAATFDRLSAPFRTELDAQPTIAQKYSPDYWRTNAYGNAMVRLRLICENNFLHIETFGLLAVARYIFELSVWLKLIQSNEAFSLIYYRELIETQRRYYKDSVDQLRREVDLLNAFEMMDNEIGTPNAALLPASGSSTDFGALLQSAMSRVDAAASRNFSIYSESAKINGYGFQAYLVKSKELPRFQAAHDELVEELAQFEAQVPKSIRDVAKGKWQWRSMAKLAGIEHEHDYIYSYASKLLHATPASLTTDQKNLELEEVAMFLRYIYVKLLEVADLAHRQPECTLKLE